MIGFSVVVSNTPMCIGSQNSGWLLNYAYVPQNSHTANAAITQQK
jgi:hypothetical protein